MALTATIHHLRIDLSDVDRGVYEALDLRVARHPSESLRYMLLRTIAYGLCYVEGIAFSKGLFVTDEPAVWARQGDGRVDLWVDIGRPSIERLHKASKLGARVTVFTHDDPELLRREARGAKLHKGEDIEVCSVDVALLDALEAKIDRNMSLTLVHNDGQLYVTVGDRTMEGAVTRRPLVDRED
jgi:uncharacterized protein YaeQ